MKRWPCDACRTLYVAPIPQQNVFCALGHSDHSMCLTCWRYESDGGRAKVGMLPMSERHVVVYRLAFCPTTEKVLRAVEG